jgi:hypothetical protein
VTITYADWFMPRPVIGCGFMHATTAATRLHRIYQEDNREWVREKRLLRAQLVLAAIFFT